MCKVEEENAKINAIDNKGQFVFFGGEAKYLHVGNIDNGCCSNSSEYVGDQDQIENEISAIKFVEDSVLVADAFG